METGRFACRVTASNFSGEPSNMENLHAPWRINFILAPKEPGCFFCRAASETDGARFKGHLMLLRRSGIIVIMNRYPYNGGHLMVAPTRHSGDISSLTDAECAAITRAVRTCAKILRDKMNPAGFNIGINVGKVAGAGVEDHLHVHVVPRWLGDTNFMPVLAGTSTVPEALDELYERLKPDFDTAAGEI